MNGAFDLLVIGGGVNGAGVARDAAGRGLRVALAERDDLAAHTSSASTKLVHGGLRYLEHGAFRLVAEALREREILMRAAPHLVRPMRFILPLDRRAGGRPGWTIRLGLVLYDHIGGARTLKASARERLAGGPLRPDIGAGFSYSDCRVDDARLTVLAAMDAQARGARILTRTRCVGLRREDGMWRAMLRGADGRESPLSARAVVNAAGAGTQEVARAAGVADAPRLRLIKGGHIVTRGLFAGDAAYLLQQPDGRVVFAIPYLGDFTLIGTTDIPVATQEEGERISEAEIAYLCAAVNRWFARAISPEDVIWRFAGVRTLADSGPDNPSKLSRDDLLLLDAQAGAPMLSIIGGKLTTHRRVAERAMARLAPFFPGIGADWTAHAVLPGGDLGAADMDAFVQALARDYPWLEAPILRRLADTYGACARRLLGDAHGAGDLGRHYGAGLYAREVEYLAAQEFAQTADDILWRRTKLGLTMAAEAQAALRAHLGG